MTEKLLRPFREQKIPVIGFVNEGRHQLEVSGLREILDMWLDAGAELGNHSYSHPESTTSRWISTPPTFGKANPSRARRWRREASIWSISAILFCMWVRHPMRRKGCRRF
jgi:hypothetical protein